jgi:cytochrome P450
MPLDQSWPPEDGLGPFAALPDPERHRFYARLTAEAPLHHIRQPGGAPAWLVTSHALTRSLLADSRVIKLGPEHAPFAKRLSEEVRRGINHHMLFDNPPTHTRLRRLVSAAFTRTRVDSMLPFIRARAGELLDVAEPGQVVDLIREVAYPLPIAVIGALLGVPEHTDTAFQRWSRTLVDPTLSSFGEFEVAASGLLSMVRELIEQKRREPGEDLFSALVQIREGDDRLSEDELTSMAYLLVMAGFETTAHLIGNAAWALLGHPDQLKLLRGEPDRVNAAIEEVLRYDAPVQTSLPYTVSSAIEVSGRVVPPGDLVYFSLLAANRDPAAVERPDQFDITRAQLTNTAFGHGLHHCLGAPLARLEARVVIDMLVTKFPAWELASPRDTPRRIPAMTVNGLESLPVTLR